ncbi:MAG: AMP-binding protein [Pseudomonadota bacterium]
MQHTTLQEVLSTHAQDATERSALHCWDGAQREYVPVSYAALSRRAFAFGARLMAQGTDGELPAGSVVMIACHSPYATLVAFYGAISVGAIPMIFPMPLSLGSHEALSARIEHWGFAFERPALLVLESGLVEKFHDDIPAAIKTVRLSDDPAAEIDEQNAPARAHQPLPEDVAFFQTTSSSTGDHKAVAISHANIIANVVGIRHAQNMDANERMATWLPLFHDMGLVGTVLFSFCNDYPLLIMTPTQFVKRPALWLKGMHEYECTIATAPNFGFDYCSRLVSEKDANEMDLRKVKHLFIGAEPIRVSTVHSFVEKFSVAGIGPQVIRPAYGLAESTIITTMTDPDKVSQFVCLDADAIGINEPVTVLDQMRFDDPRMAQHDSAKSIAVCTAGSVIEGMLVELVDEQGELIEGEGIAGEIAITGTSVAMGYVGGRENLVDRFDQGRTRTGDMGVFLEGELYILERLKNVIIRNGENFLVSALEEHLADLLDISHEHVAVFESDIHNPDSDIVVMVERHGTIDEDAVNRLLVSMPKEAFPINRILLSKSREIPRTTSGKKRHFYCRKLYQKDEIKHQQSIEVSPQRIVQAMKALDTQA